MNKKQKCGIIKKVITDEIEALDNLKESIDIDSIIKTIDMIDECVKNNGKVITMGAGNSSIIARKVAHNFSNIEIPSFFLSSEEGLHGGFGVIQKNDIVIAFSKGGKTREMLETIPVVKHKKAKMVSVTENENTEFGKAVDLVLIVKTDREADPFNIISTSSSTCIIAIFDAIMILMMQQKGFKEEQIAIIHPGGAVGEILKNKFDNKQDIVNNLI